MREIRYNGFLCREEFRIRTDVAEWNNNDYCQSVNLSGFVLERNWSRNTVDDATLAVGVRPDFFNLFEYCAGTGGYQLCSLQMNFSYDQFSPGPNMLGPNMSSIEYVPAISAQVGNFDVLMH